MIQITLIQIDNFGPYTEEMGDNREHKIQILLSEVFISLQKKFNKYGNLVFLASRDNLLAVSNGISIEDHQLIANELEKEFPITVSMGIGVGETPLEAQIEASRVLIAKGSAQSSRKKVIAYNGHKLPIQNDVMVAHVDINYYTKTTTDINPFYSNFLNLNKGYATLMENFQKIGALCFFSGGDNFITICPESMKSSDLENVLISFEKKHEPWTLKAGIGVAKNILDAIVKANLCLRKIREGDNKEKIKFLNYIK